MGEYFFMSMRMNKSDAADFGLIPYEENKAINPKDNSIWEKKALYDFGWGSENGFYRMPLPDFETLFELVLQSTNRDDRYGSAAIILERFPNELLQKCELIANDHFRKKDFKKLTEIFRLKEPINRSPVLKKTFEEIRNDYIRWKNLSETAKKL